MLTLAIVISTNRELSVQYMLLKFNCNFYMSDYGYVNLLDTFDRKACVIRINILSSYSYKLSQSKLNYVKRKYNINKKTPIIYMNNLEFKSKYNWSFVNHNEMDCNIDHQQFN